MHRELPLVAHKSPTSKIYDKYISISNSNDKNVHDNLINKYTFIVNNLNW